MKLISLLGVALIRACTASVFTQEEGHLTEFGAQVQAAPAPHHSARHEQHTVPQRRQSLLKVARSRHQGASLMQAESQATPQGYQICKGFIDERLRQGSSGVQLVKELRATCEPAVEAGRGLPAFRDACDSLRKMAATVVSSTKPITAKALCIKM